MNAITDSGGSTDSSGYSDSEDTPRHRRNLQAFTEKEDILLVRIASKCTHKHWDILAKHIIKRSGKTCREHLWCLSYKDHQPISPRKRRR